MTDLIERLKAAIDEVERIARAATGGPWAWDTEGNPGWGGQGPCLMSGDEIVLAGWGHDAWGLEVSEPNMAHIARHDPERVLRQVEAHRRIVADHEQMIARHKELRLAGTPDLGISGALLALAGVTKHLAQAYGIETE